MIRFWNWPPWPQDAQKNGNKDGFGLVGLLVSLAISISLINVLAASLQIGMNTYRTTTDLSETTQSTSIALNWIRKDLQAACEIIPSFDQHQLRLKLPQINPKDLTNPQWYWATYRYDYIKSQLQRSINNSNNIVAEGIGTFTVTLDVDKPLATIIITPKDEACFRGFKSRVYLRNLTK